MVRVDDQLVGGQYQPEVNDLYRSQLPVISGSMTRQWSTTSYEKVNEQLTERHRPAK